MVMSSLSCQHAGQYDVMLCLVSSHDACRVWRAMFARSSSSALPLSFSPSLRLSVCLSLYIYTCMYMYTVSQKLGSLYLTITLANFNQLFLAQLAELLVDYNRTKPVESRVHVLGTDLPCFDIVGWVMWPVKTRRRYDIYNVFVGTYTQLLHLPILTFGGPVKEWTINNIDD